MAIVGLTDWAVVEATADFNHLATAVAIYSLLIWVRIIVYPACWILAAHIVIIVWPHPSSIKRWSERATLAVFDLRRITRVRGTHKEVK